MSGRELWAWILGLHAWLAFLGFTWFAAHDIALVFMAAFISLGMLSLTQFRQAGTAHSKSWRAGRPEGDTP